MIFKPKRIPLNTARQLKIAQLEYEWRQARRNRDWELAQDLEIEILVEQAMEGQQSETRVQEYRS